MNFIQYFVFLNNFINDFGCQIDTVNNLPDDIKGFNLSEPLKKGDVSGEKEGFYQYKHGTATNFTRQIQIKLDPNDNSINDEALVAVTVRLAPLTREATPIVGELSLVILSLELDPESEEVAKVGVAGAVRATGPTEVEVPVAVAAVPKLS